MATREIDETTFDEDVQTDSSANQCPECNGWVTTNAIETVCEDCGLVVDKEIPSTTQATINNTNRTIMTTNP